MKVSDLQILFILFVVAGLTLGIVKAWPDGKVHIVFCDVGQGDGMYIKTPTGADIVIDGGPNERILTCLGHHMPFYDRTIDLVISTHPQKDHFYGLIGVFKRYSVKHFVTVPVGHDTPDYHAFKQVVEGEKSDISYFTAGEQINLGKVSLRSLWPTLDWLQSEVDRPNLGVVEAELSEDLLTYLSQNDLNRISMYFHLRYGEFDALLTGDGDAQVQAEFVTRAMQNSIPARVEVLKVPHHGSGTGMDNWFIEQVRPIYAVIQVGKNSYGHPHPRTLEQLGSTHILRNDLHGMIEVVSDGASYQVFK